MALLYVINTLFVITACGVSAAAVWQHLKNYRKPMDQRLIVRILMMVPIFSISAWLNLYCSVKWIDELVTFIRELYEAFVIYTFYTLLTNLLGGERAIIFTTTGRAPVRLWGGYRLDISDPPTFLMIKRLVMQYVWIRPLTAILFAVTSSSWLHVLIAIGYNVSITLALQALTLFWICLRDDLAPYRVVLKFLSVKLIVFFSYWQSLTLDIISSLGWISADTLNVVSNSLMCWETLAFAYVHWRAFPASDYSATVMFGFARLRIDAAFRDAFGYRDLIYDFRTTFLDSNYDHRTFDSVEAVLDHPDSQTRKKRLAAGLRYRNGGRSKYWLPDSSLRKLLHRAFPEQRDGSIASTGYGSTASRGDTGPRYDNVEEVALGEPPSEIATANVPPLAEDSELGPEEDLSDSEETIYDQARGVYGDYNYPVVTVRESEEYVSFEDRLRWQQILESV